MIYFDNAATTGYKPWSVINSVNNSLKNLSANPGRSGHKISQKAAMAVYNAREKLCDYFGGKGVENVVFTANCTQSINFVIKGVLDKDDHIVVSDMEHNAVMRPIAAMGIEYSKAFVSLENDEITIENFKSAIKRNTKMIFCTAASNVLGKILPLKEIGKICKEKGILFGVDAAQGAGVIPINMIDMNIDYLCIAAHKGLYCPMGLGILIANSPINKTLIEGGTGTNSIDIYQPNVFPEMLESGTLNLPAISSIPAGIDFLISKEKKILKYENDLVKKLYTGIKNFAVLYTDPLSENYVPVLSFNIANISSEFLAEYLNKNNFALRAGLHCAPEAHKKIGTLKQGTVRFSPSVFNNCYEVEKLINALKKFSKNH